MHFCTCLSCSSASFRNKFFSPIGFSIAFIGYDTESQFCKGETLKANLQPIIALTTNRLTLVWTPSNIINFMTRSCNHQQQCFDHFS